MPPLQPIKRRELIRRLKKLGFTGPYSGGKHQYLVKDHFKLAIPNPHQGDIGPGLLARILRQAHISREEWDSLK